MSPSEPSYDSALVSILVLPLRPFSDAVPLYCFPHVELAGATQGSVGDSYMEPGRRRYVPRFQWRTMADDSDRRRYQGMFRRALVACCGADASDAERFWTTHAGRVGMQTDGDERGLDRRKTRLLGGWAYDPRQRSQDHYSRTVHTLASLSSERGF